MITREEYDERMKTIAQPIDFTDLAARGLLMKEGDRYRVRNIQELPRHVSDKIVEIESTTGVPGALVKFN